MTFDERYNIFVDHSKISISEDKKIRDHDNRLDSQLREA